MSVTSKDRVAALIASPDEASAMAIVAQGEEAVVFALLRMAKELAEKNQADNPATPSGMQPVYTKPPAKTRKKKSGAKRNHTGSHRAKPDRIDRYETHRAEACPDCGGKLNQCSETRVRYIEDLPETQPEITEHTIHRDWCPNCKKKVEPPVPDALPGSTLGLHVLVLTAWLHYALGNTLRQIVDVLNFHHQLQLTPGGLIQMWYRLQEILYSWYQQIQTEALSSAVLHGDETGWRVDGKTHWLWCFGNDDLTYYMIDKSRGSPALAEFFTTEFNGTLVTDFWGAYNAIDCADRQMCLVHLLRELKQTEKYKSPGENWPAFSKKLKRLIGDAIRLWRSKGDLEETAYQSRRARITKRLEELVDRDWQDGNAKRLIKRLRRHAEDLFTFLDKTDLPFENNLAERSIRPAVIIRKNSYGNRSQQGADCQAVMMSVLRTLKQRGHNPISTVVKAIKSNIKTGILKPLPAKVTSDS